MDFKMSIVRLLYFTIILLCSFLQSSKSSSSCNDRPIIGIIAEETGKHFAKYGSSSITASYVKFIESSGARVVPIMIRKPIKYYESLLGQINGVLFPGGANLLTSTGYGRTGRIIFDIATKFNKKGDYFPLWGTCLGFELLNFLAVNKMWMKSCAAEDMAANINFAPGFKGSKLFRDIDGHLLQIMQTQNVTINYHRWCLTLQNYTLSGLDKFFKVLAVNNDTRNVTFISIIEALDFPYFGVAFHPEKVPFEWVLKKSHMNIPHSAEAITVSRYFGDFFVNEARKSNHHFPNKTVEDSELIYNYVPTFTGKLNADTIQYYFFP